MKKVLLTLVFFIAFSSFSVSQCLDNTYVITGDSEVCAGTTTNYMIPFEENVTYQWRVVPQGFQFQDNYGGTISFNQNNAEVIWNELPASFGDPLIIATRTTDDCGGNGSETISLQLPISKSHNSPGFYTNDIIGTRSLCGLTTTAYTFKNTWDLDINITISSGGVVTSSSPSGNDTRVYIQWNEIGSHLVNVEYSNNCGESRFDSFSVDVYEDFDTPTISGSTEVCYGETYTFTTPYEEGVEYNWFGLGISSTSTSNVAEVNITGTYETSYVRVTASRNGCSKTSDYLYINVNQNRLTNIGGDYPSCYELNTPYTYTVNQGLGSIYSWDLSGGGTIEVDGNTATIIWHEYGTHTITVEESTICEIKSTSRAVAVGLQQPNEIAESEEQCLSQEAYYSLSKSNSVNTTNYYWNIIGDGTIIENVDNSNFSALRVKWNTVGPKQVTCVASNDCGESITKSFDLNVIDYEEISEPIILIGKTEICSNNINYYYSIDDQNPIKHSAYYLFVYDEYNNEITSHGGGSSNSGYISSSHLNLELYNSVRIDLKVRDSKCGINPNVVSSLNVQIYPSLDDNYEIEGSCIGIVGQPETYTVVTQPDAIYEWRDWNSSIISTEESAEIIWPETGTFRITQKTSNPGCNNATKVLYVNVYESTEQEARDKVGTVPDIPIISGPNQKCKNIYETYSVTNSEAGVLYHWNLKDINNQLVKSSSNYSDAWSINESPGIYTLGVKAERCGLFSAEALFNVEILDLERPEKPIIVGNDYGCFDNENIYSIENPIEGYSYSWELNPSNTGTISIIDNTTISVNWDSEVNTGGTNRLVIAYANNGTCSSSGYGGKQVQMQYFSTISISGSSLVCAQYLSEFEIVYGTSTDQYQWYVDGGYGYDNTTSKSIDIKWTTSGWKNISVDFTRNGCTETFTHSVYVDPASNPFPIVGPGTVCVGEIVEYELSTSILPNGYGVYWSGGHVVSQSGTTVQIKWTNPSPEGEYTNLWSSITGGSGSYCGFSTRANKQIRVLGNDEPNILSSNAVLTSVTDSQMNLSWTPGNGTQRLVLVAEDNPQNGSPVDLSIYNANNQYGSGDNIGLGYAVFSDVGNSFTLTGLRPDTQYNFSIFEYKADQCPDAPNYLTSATSNTANRYSFSFSTLCELSSEPTPTISTINFTSVSHNSMDLSWVNGNGTNRLVIASEINPVSENPIDGFTDYYYDESYRSGYHFGNGNYVVYNGVGNSANVSGLLASTKYHFALFEYNDDGCYQKNYLESAVATNNITTLCFAPSTPDSGTSGSFSYSDVRDTRMNITFPTGNGNKRIVVARAGGSVNASPADGNINYSASNTFTNGYNLGNGNYVIYNGTGNSVTLMGLNPSTTYHFKVFEYNENTNCSLSRNYNQDSSVSHSKATLCSMPGQPSNGSGNITFNDVRNTRMNLSFPKGTGQKRLVIARKNWAVIKEPADGNINYSANSNFGSGYNLGSGNYVVYNGTGNSFTLTGLEPSTKYQFAIFEYNENTGCYIKRVYATSGEIIGNRTTLCTEPSVPSPASSATVSSPKTDDILNFTWTNGTGNGRLVVARAGGAVNANPVDGAIYSASPLFGTGTQIGSGNYVVYNGTANFCSISRLNPSTTYHIAVYEYNVDNGCYVNTTRYTTKTTTYGTTMCTNPQPSSPSGVSFSNITSSSMRVSWSSGNGYGNLLVARKNYAVNKTPADNGAYSSSTTFGNGYNLGSGNYIVYVGLANYTYVYGLDPSSTYYFEVFEYNFDDGCYPFANYNPNGATGFKTTQASSGGGDPCLQAHISKNELRSSASIEDQLVIIPDCDLSSINGVNKLVKVNFSSPLTAKSEIHVFDMTGKKVKYVDNCNEAQTEVTMDFSDLPDYSILIVQVFSEFESKSVKVMLSR